MSRCSKLRRWLKDVALVKLPSHDVKWLLEPAKDAPLRFTQTYYEKLIANGL